MITVTDIFAGAGGSTSGAIMVPGVEVRVSANHWQLAVDVHQVNHPTTDHACVDLHLEDPRFFPRTDVLWASPECFTAGHLVTTERGQVPIEDVVVGDLVLTHRGRWRSVVRLQSRTAPTVVVKGQGHAGIETTASHRFWLRSSHLQWMGRPEQYRRQYTVPAWEAIGDAPDRQALWATPVRVQRLEIHTPPAAFGFVLTAAWWLIGRWVGDGSLTFARNHEVLIAGGFHEADELRERLVDTGTAWAESRKRTAVVFSTGDEKARDWLLVHFGHGAAHKQIPSWALGMIHTHRRALLEGYFSADGYASRLTHGRQHQITTVSRKLAVSARLLAETLGHRVSVGRDHRTTYTIEGRTGAARPQYKIAWNPNPSEIRRSEGWADGLHAWSRVRSVTPGSIHVTVYNIEVEEDHSYVLDGIVVANCTRWSQARGRAEELSAQTGGDATLFDQVPEELTTTESEESTRSRLLMFDVLRFVEHHRYRAVVVENVVDIATQAKYASAWRLWQGGLRSLGYRIRVVSHNAMHAQAYGLPAPQSRDRLYVVAWPEREKAPDIDAVMRPKAWCPRCDVIVESVQAWKPGRTVGKYRTQYVYACSHCGITVEPGWLPASAAIDWTLRGQRIGDRDKPLADKTRARIAAGIARYWGPLHLEAAGHTYDAADPNHPAYGDPNAYYRSWPADDYLRTLHNTSSKALAVPFMLERRFEYRTKSVDDPMATLTANDTSKALVAPFIAELRGGGSTARSVKDPAATFTASGNHHGLVCPAGGTWNDQARSTGQALRALTTREAYALVAPYYGNSDTAHPSSDPLGTVTTRDRHALIMRNNEGGAEMSTPVREVMRTLTSRGHQSLVTPGELDAARAQVDDCEFRMFEPHEVAAGMAFPLDYQWLGSRRDRVKLAGNAVCPPTARDLVGAVVDALT